MCVKLITTNSEVAYDVSTPLEKQLKGCKQIIIDYQPNDPSIEKFLDEVERFCLKGIPCNLNIKVNPNNQILGAKTKKRAKKVQKGLKVNDLIKMMTLSYDKTDKDLEDLANQFKACK